MYQKNRAHSEVCVSDSQLFGAPWHRPDKSKQQNKKMFDIPAPYRYPVPLPSTRKIN